VAESAADRVQRNLDALIERAAKALVLEIVRELKRRGTGTPVKTGHARANWIASVGAPNTVEAPGTSEAVAQAGNAVVASYKLGQGRLYVSNVVPYIRRLNEGSSTQAAPLFVESCVIRAMAKVKEKMGVDFGLAAAEADFAAKAQDVAAQGAENLADAYAPF
jgi:hypothetical protein